MLGRRHGDRVAVGRHQGRERYRKLVAAASRGREPVSFDVHHLAFDGRLGCSLADWTIRARRREDGVLIEWRGLSVCEFRGDKITWWREHHLAPPAPVDHVTRRICRFSMTRRPFRLDVRVQAGEAVVPERREAHEPSFVDRRERRDVDR